MNTPELKVGQRFLARLESGNEITELEVTKTASDGAFLKCFWRHFNENNDQLERNQWFERQSLVVLCIFDNDQP